MGWGEGEAGEECGAMEEVGSECVGGEECSDTIRYDALVPGGTRIGGSLQVCEEIRLW